MVKRATHDNTSWEQAQFEVPAHRFIDMSEPGFGVALLNDAKYGHSAKGNLMGLSLVRSPLYPDPLADEVDWEDEDEAGFEPPHPPPLPRTRNRPWAFRLSSSGARSPPPC